MSTRRGVPSALMFVTPEKTVKARSWEAYCSRSSGRKRSRMPRPISSFSRWRPYILTEAGLQSRMVSSAASSRKTALGMLSKMALWVRSDACSWCWSVWMSVMSMLISITEDTLPSLSNRGTVCTNQ